MARQLTTWRQSYAQINEHNGRLLGEMLACWRLAVEIAREFDALKSSGGAPGVLWNSVEEKLTRLSGDTWISQPEPVPASQKVRVESSLSHAGYFDLFIGDTYLGKFDQPTVTPLANAIGAALGQYPK